MQHAIERMPSDVFKPRPVKYVDVAKLFPIFDGLYDQPKAKPFAMCGPKGVGKSLSVAAYAAKRDLRIVTFDCSEDVRRSHLLGNFVLRGDATPFVLGPLPTAFEVANETGACILVLEEMNGLTPQMQKVLNGVTDFRCRVEVPEAQKVFELRDGAKLWIVGTMNTAVYGGVYSLNEDLKSRLRMLDVGYPSAADEKKVVAEALNGAAAKINPKDLDLVLTLATETRQTAIDYALSTRDVVQMLEDISALGVEMAMRLILAKFEGDDKATITQRITSIFGVAL